ncbi:glycosyltransferase 87 family protein [Granulicoccus phenolivorans]|uniref:glycosyltransferase 87 family protein n=1 Tax=Granulicoccus phenolivorans TaxID=266854 RepID=UPI00040DAEED|nr:glycosyltransferase 87 family protein [Granulicoccus phenolivorans]
MSRRLQRWAVEIGPALLVAIMLVPFIISGGRLVGWQPAMIDLDVYRYTVADLLAGKDIYLTRTPYYQLPFLYPPVAAIVLIPIALIPLRLLQLLWILLLVWCQWLVLRCLGVRRGWLLGAVNMLAVIAVEPLRTTLGYGQVNTIAMALVVVDLLGRRSGTRRLPPGVLIGLAAALKLTPLLFLVFAAARRDWAMVRNGVLSFCGAMLVGLLILPQATLTYFNKLLAGDMYGNPVYVGNQSLAGLVTRLAGGQPGPAGTVTTVLCVVLGAVAVYGAVRVWSRGARAYAVGLLGMATGVVSPISWTHHYVWVIVVAIGAIAAGARIPDWLRWISLAWSAWVSLCPVLVFLPYGMNAELGYSIGQHIVGGVTPVLGAVIIAAVGVSSAWWSTPADAGPGSEPGDANRSAAEATRSGVEATGAAAEGTKS